MRFAEPPSAMQPQAEASRSPRRGEQGAALIVALIATVALLGIGMATMLAVRSDTSASASDRFQQIALYAAESGANAGIDFLRSNCETNGNFYTQYLGTSPTGITGNGIAAGQSGNPFTGMASTYYQVTINNNTAETNAAVDSDGTVVLRSVGYGPNNTQVTLDVEVTSGPCKATFCASEFAQKNIGSLNDTSGVSICNEAKVTGTGWRTVDLSGS
jgi:Tfp pilus assembly protein PilX